MKIQTTYAYSQQLQHRLYVERAERASGATIEIEDSQLSADGRKSLAASLAVSVAWPQEACLLTPDARVADHRWPPSATVEAAHACGRLTVDAGTVDEEPAVADAVRDVEDAVGRAAASAVRDTIAALEGVQSLTRQLAAWHVRLQRRARAASLTPEELIGPSGGWDTVDRPWGLRPSADDLGFGLLVGGAGWDGYEQRYAELRAQARTLVQRRNAAAAQQRLELEHARAAWVAEHLPAHLDRYAEGLMPFDELTQHARAAVFAPLDAIPRYRKIRASEVPHGEECYSPHVEFGVEQDAPLGARQYDRLRVLRDAVAQLPGATVSLREHSGICQCGDCDFGRDRVVRVGALVSVTWFGTPLSREYSLDEDGAATAVPTTEAIAQ